MKVTNPSRSTLCVLLARGDHVAAHLLDRICHWAQYGKAKVKGAEGEWVANTRPWWMREALLSKSQLDRSLAKLAKFDLVERQQAKFAGGTPILHVRPSAFTRDFLTAAKTWSAASEILALQKIPLPEALAKLEAVEPPLVKMLAAWGGEVTSAELGKLAVFRQDIKAVALAGTTYDFTTSALPLISWAKANWIEISTKEAIHPSLTHFCSGLYMEALKVTMKDVGGGELKFDPA